MVSTIVALAPATLQEFGAFDELEPVQQRVVAALSRAARIGGTGGGGCGTGQRVEHDAQMFAAFSREFEAAMGRTVRPVVHIQEPAAFAVGDVAVLTVLVEGIDELIGMAFEQHRVMGAREVDQDRLDGAVYLCADLVRQSVNCRHDHPGVRS
jgi:hypothetical protein